MVVRLSHNARSCRCRGIHRCDLDAHGREIEVGRLSGDVFSQPFQRSAGTDPEFAVEFGLGPPVGAQGLGATPGAVQAEHELTPNAFVQRGDSQLILESWDSSAVTGSAIMRALRPDPVSVRKVVMSTVSESVSRRYPVASVSRRRLGPRRRRPDHGRSR